MPARAGSCRAAILALPISTSTVFVRRARSPPSVLPCEIIQATNTSTQLFFFATPRERQNVQALNKHLMSRRQPSSARKLRTTSGFGIHPAESPGPRCKEAVPAPPIHEAPPARPHLLNDLSTGSTLNLTTFTWLKGTTPSGPTRPPALGVHHLVVDAVTEKGKEEQGATALTAEQDHPWGSKPGCQELSQRPQAYSLR